MKRECKNRILLNLILFLVPLVFTSVYCLFDGKTIFDVSLVDSGWNDELFYYKLTENVVNCGYPRGFFGFNESHARVLSFAAWSPLLLVQWVLWGILFGWNMVSPYLSNIVTVGISLFVFGMLAKPNRKQLLLIIALLASFVPFTRFLLSCLPEAEVLSLMILYTGFCVSSLGKIKSDLAGVKADITGMYFVTAFMTWMRPYLLVFLLLPTIELGTVILKKHKVIKSMFILGCTAGLIMAVYMIIAKMFGAPYLQDLFYTDWLRAYKDGAVYGISYTFSKLGNSLWTVFYLIKSVFSDEVFHAGGLYYLVFICAVIVSVSYLIHDLTHMKKEKTDMWAVIAEAQLTFAMLAFLFADLLMYRIQEGGRHTFVFIVGFIMLIPMIRDKKEERTGAYVPVGLPIIAVYMLLIFLVFGNSPYEFSLPYKSEASSSRYNELSETLENSMVLLETKTPSYENTVIWNYGTDYSDFVNYYAVPKGFGINLCVEDYLLSNMDSLNSRYIGTAKDNPVNLLCIEKQYEIVGETSTYAFYKRY